ncbi:MAG: PEP-CTERM sorting domain-containing protein [Phycisphaerales bacterium]|nr:PEP-CTERM sorting domain-containing protein [Phycisphaerales bacterium]MCB9855965.1 PEP-CTERM sorting domain-containing protein [Phycisphaerales bacterium]
MGKKNLFVAAIAALLGGSTAFAGIPSAVYDNIGGPNDGLSFSSNVLNDNWIYDDLHVSGGGLLAGFSFAYGTEAFQGFAEGDGDVVLYLDDGATSPGVLDTNEDTLLLTDNYRGLSATAGNFGAVIYERQDTILPVPSIVIPDGATIWAGMKFSHAFGGNLHGVHFAPISIGTSDQFTYDDNNPPFDLVTFGLPANAGLGWELYTVPVPEPTTLSLLAIGGIALLRRRR